MSKKVFIANNEKKKNSYGFRVLTAGINLEERFKDNPVCLNNHVNDTKNTLGTWINVKKDGAILSAEPKFNTKDPEGEEVVRKVNEDVLKGCSMGIMFNPADLVYQDDELVLLQCVLFEISIVPVPSNASAITLYNTEGVKLSEDDIKSFCLSAQQKQSFNNNTMKQVITYLQLDANADEAAVLAGIKAIEAKLSASETEKTTLQGQVTALQAAETARLSAELDAEMTLAKKDGRIDAAGEEPIREMPAASALKLLKALPKRKSVQEQVDEQGDGKELDRFDKLSWRQLDQQNLLQSIKLNHPDYYAQRFEQQYGRKPSK